MKARSVSERSGEIHDRLFATNVAFSKQKPNQVVERYSEWWAIENEGIRELIQRWRARVPIGRKFSAIYAQLTMLAMCYNAMKDYAMKKPKEAKRLKLECRPRTRRSYLLGQTNIIFILRRRIYMVTNMRGLAQMSQERTIRRLEHLMLRGLSAKEAMAQARQDGILRN